MYLETMQQIFASTSKVLMDTKQSNNMIYLPIDKMMASESNSSKPVVAQPAAPAPAEQIPSVEMRYNKDGRTRDTRDSRDREVR